MNILNKINEVFNNIEIDESVEISMLNDFKNEILSEYRKFWKKLENEHSAFEEMTYHEHVNVLQAIGLIEELIEQVGSDATLYTSEAIRSSVEESLRDNYYELIDNVEAGSWPYSYVEFDIEGAIDEAVDNANQYRINDLVLYEEVDVYSIY